MNSVLNELDNQTNAFDYCVNKAIPNGSNLYYSTLFETQENKTILVAFHAFLFELYDVIYECKDPGVARIKFKWWQEEIERLFDDKARHPVTKQLHRCISFNENLKSTFNSVIDFFNHYIFIEQIDSIETIIALYKSTSGEIWSQCHKQLSDKNNKLETIEELGAVIQYLMCLQQPFTYINETRCIVPATIINTEDLLKLRFDTDTRQQRQNSIFSPLICELITRLENIVHILKENKNGLNYDLIMTKLAIKTCHEILGDGCNLLDRNISLTPLRKLWIAWLTRTFH